MNYKMIDNYKICHMARTHFLLICLVLFILVSCSKDKQLDMDLLTAKAANSISYVLGGNVVRLNDQNYNFTNAHIGVAIPLTEQVKSADTVVASIDPSLVATYNREHLESNMAIPEGAFTVTHDGIFPVSANTSSAADSLYVLLKEGSALKNGSVYLVPVRLSTKKGAKLKYSTFYFKMRVNIGQLRAMMDAGTVYKGAVISRYVGGGALNITYINGFPDSLSFSVRTNSIFPAHDVKVEASILDDTQTDSLSRAKNFNALPFPANTYTLSRSLATIGTKSMVSTDSITVRFKNRPSFITARYYLLSIKLKHYKGSEYGVPPVPANDSSSVYIRMFLL